MRRIALPGKMMRQYGVNRRSAVRSVANTRVSVISREARRTGLGSMRKFMVAVANPGSGELLEVIRRRTPEAVACGAAPPPRRRPPLHAAADPATARNPVRRATSRIGWCSRRIQDAFGTGSAEPPDPRERLEQRNLVGRHGADGVEDARARCGDGDLVLLAKMKRRREFVDAVLRATRLGARHAP